ncbi:MAG: CHAP domain-containing protein [Candidatus Saccharibacteria bacterium]
MTFIFVGSLAPQKRSIDNDLSNSTSQSISNISVNDVIATNIASSVARATNLPVAPNITNLAISTQIKSSFANSAITSETRPQVIVPVTENRLVTQYTVKDGENINDLATRFKISVDTIKWANKLTGDQLYSGKILKILPIDGVLHMVNSSDTVDSIASKYQVDKTRIVLYNDLDVSGLVPNTEIILPSATLPENERAGYRPPSRFNYYFMPGSVGNRYDWGNCTWYAYEQRLKIGRPVGSFWGNADTWALAASGAGNRVDNKPEAGAVFVDTGGQDGHVAIVVGVSDNGDISLSEMNLQGLNIISSRTITAEQAASYKYVH